MNQYQTSPFWMPPVVKNLIMINIVMLVATIVLEKTGIDFLNTDLTIKLGLFYPGSESFRPYQFVTHMFMHGGFQHLLFNMFALFMFGTEITSI